MSEDRWKVIFQAKIKMSIGLMIELSEIYHKKENKLS